MRCATTRRIVRLPQPAGPDSSSDGVGVPGASAGRPCPSFATGRAIRPFFSHVAGLALAFAATVQAANPAAAIDVAGDASVRAGCMRDCSGYLRDNVRARPLTEARIEHEAGARRDAWRAYLAASVRARDTDRAALRMERGGLQAIPPPRSPDANGLDRLPLDRPPSAYADDASLAIARAILSYQIPSGGWGKNMPRDAVPRRRGESWLSDALDPESPRDADWHFVGTLDNGASTTELRFLAKVQRVQSRDRAALRSGLVRGIDWLLAAQFPDGGWPQVYPLAGGYADAVTLNDDAMLSAVRLLHEIGRDQDGDFAFVDAPRRARAAEAARRGIAWWVAHQVVIDGRRTLWAQQHDALTGAPAPARAFEMPALATHESAGVLRFLMALPDPGDDVRAAIRGGVDFLRATRIAGWRWRDDRLVADPAAAVWARFYAPDRFVPEAPTPAQRAQALFGDRPEPHGSAAYGLVFDRVESVSEERRRGYRQYDARAEDVLAAWPRWAARHPR